MANSKYNFNSLEIGNTIEVEGDRNKIAASACVHGKRHGKKFSVKNGTEGKFIVTRTA